MKRTIAVHLGEDTRPIGVLRYDQQGARESAVFQYEPHFLRETHRFALAPGLPLVEGPQFHRKTREGSVFHPVIADTEPDGWGRRVILRDHAKRRQELRRAGELEESGPLNSMDFLLAVDDASRVGALRFQDEEGRFQRTVEKGQRSTPPIVELAQLLAASRAVETHTETAADLAYLRGSGTSLGGLRPKCSIIDHDGWLAIGKFPSVADERPITKGEVLAMRLAKRAGIDAADARLVDSDGKPIAVIRRFDRVAGDGRLMYVSAATMLDAEPGDAGEHSYTELVDALRQYGADPLADIEELWRRIAFSILITNVDDHLLNHGFLHTHRGLWRLSPAFDLNPFPDRVRELKTWISEETGPEATIDALMSVLPYFRIPRDRASAILGKVEASVATWQREARALGMTGEEIDSFTEAFEHPEREAARGI